MVFSAPKITFGSPLSRLLFLQTVCLHKNFNNLTEIQVYTKILSHYDYKTKKCVIGEEKIAAAVGRSTRTVRRCIAKFQTKRWLIVKRHYKNRHSAEYWNEYSFPWERVFDEDISGDADILMRTKNRVDEDKMGVFDEDIAYVRHSESYSIESPHTERRNVCDSPSAAKKESPSTKERDSSLQKNIIPADSYSEISDPLRPSASGMLRPTSSFTDSDVLAQFEALFAGKEIFPLQTNICSPLQKENIFVPGIVDAKGKLVARGDLKWVELRSRSAIKEWLVSMGLPRETVNAMRWATMVDCYNDDAVIATHKPAAVINNNDPAPAPAVPAGPVELTRDQYIQWQLEELQNAALAMADEMDAPAAPAMFAPAAPGMDAPAAPAMYAFDMNEMDAPEIPELW
jgi:hypothetical protein